MILFEQEISRANGNFICVSLDLQKLLSTPQEQNMNLYYSRKYSMFNLTISKSGSQNILAYLWGETTGARGCNEIVTCLYKYLLDLEEKRIYKSVSFFCDSCSGQNKNRAMLTMIHCIHFEFMEEVKINFLLLGHTYMPVDSIHATIERFVKNKTIWASIAIDESMIKFKGRNSSKQYMPKKPIKRGYKVWALADKHGYLWNFDVYTGKSGDTTEKNLGARVVKNFYPLITYLKLNGIYACGTVNMTRKHLPKFKDDKLFKQGDYDWRINQFSTSIIKWKDKRMVSLLSNFHDPMDTENVQRRAKDGTVSTIPCPKVLKDYNQNMNCVDKLDQNKKSCQIDRKSHKWWHRIFFHFLDIAVVNSHIVYTQATGNKMTMKNFRREISGQLLNTTIINKRKLKNTTKSPTEIKQFKPSVPDYIRLEKSSHQPKLSTRRRCARCSTKQKEVRTEWTCSICNIPLCITKSRNCFSDHHNV
ncbi:hypothetical protein QTP88_019662 [Uroleucon formosanum]